MKKIKITADAVLSIISEIFAAEAVNSVIGEDSGAESWQGRTLSEALNVEYYSFKHRPIASEELIAEKLKQGQTANQLLALNRSYCLVSLSEVERLFSRDVDMVTVAATLEYWVQTEKVKLLEALIENANIATSGIRLTVDFADAERRKVAVIFDRVNLTDIQSGTACGEMAVCEVGVSMMLYPDVVSYSDYEIAMSFNADENGEPIYHPLPLSSFSFVNTMTQKAVPYVGNTAKVGSINLSCANSFVLVFDGYNNAFINHITDLALSSNRDNNNEIYLMRLARGEQVYTHEVVVKDHQVVVNPDTSNETHTLSLVTRGVI